MYLMFILCIISFIIIATIIAFLVPPKVKKAAVLVVLCCFIMLILYFLHMPFRHEVDITFNSISHHVYMNEGDRSIGGSLPLPPQTTLTYKRSEMESEYATRANEEKIIEFFSNLDDSDEDIDIWNQSGKTFMSFYYDKELFVVEIKKVSKRICEYIISNYERSYGYLKRHN